MKLNKPAPSSWLCGFVILCNQISDKKRLTNPNVCSIIYLSGSPDGPAPQAKRLLLMLAEEYNLFRCLRRKEAPMFVTWDQLIQLLILIVALISLFLLFRHKENR